MKHIFEYSQDPENATINLAKNSLCFQKISSGESDIIARFYHHNPAVILATSEKLNGINIDACNELGYDIAKRVSGGSAIVTTPENSLCYSIFLSLDLFEKTDPSSIYSRIVLPFSDNLGKNFSVEGAYYIRYLENQKKIPIVGHAMKHKVSKKVVQLDGMVHLESLDMDVVSRVLKLRELYDYDGKKIIKAGNKYFDDRGRPIEQNIEDSKLKLLNSEEEILRSLIGLDSTEINKEDYIRIFKNTLEGAFNIPNWSTKITYDKNSLESKIHELNNTLHEGTENALGHCFVDFMEPEPDIENLD